MELKGKYKQLQDVYNTYGLLSDEFYRQIINYIKYLLSKNLRNYAYTEDDLNDCYIEIVCKIQSHYDPEKGCLANFIGAVIRNFSSKYYYHRKPKTIRDLKTKQPFTIEIVPLDFDIECVPLKENIPITGEDVEEVLNGYKNVKFSKDFLEKMKRDIAVNRLESNVYYRAVLWEVVSK